MYTVDNNQKNKKNETSVTLLDSTLIILFVDNRTIDCMLTLCYNVTGMEHTLA